jgi:hypothetical protein
MAFLWFNNHPTPLTWLRVTFGCLPSKNSVERKEIWRLTQFRRMRRVCCTPFQKTLSKNVSCSGRTAGSSVSAHKESILKLIKYFQPLAINCNFHSPSLGIFWSHLVWMFRLHMHFMCAAFLNLLDLITVTIFGNNRSSVLTTQRCCAKAVSITYAECVSVACAKRMRYIISTFGTRPALPYFPTSYKRHDFRKVSWWTQNMCFDFL